MKKNAPGLVVTKIENKIGLRMVQNGDIVMNKVFVPDEDRLPGVNSFKDTNKVRLFFFLCSSRSCLVAHFSLYAHTLEVNHTYKREFICHVFISLYKMEYFVVSGFENFLYSNL